MGKVKEKLIKDIEDTIDNPDFGAFCEAQAAKIAYSRMFKDMLVALVSAPLPHYMTDAPTAADYIRSAKNLTKAALDHLKTI